MSRASKSRYDNYVGNVTLRDRRGFGHYDRVVWIKGNKYSEKQIAKMLNDAYNRGRKEALQDVADRITEVVS